RVHLAGMVRDGGGQIDRPEDAYAVVLDHFARTSQFAVSAALGSDVYDNRARRHSLDHLARDEHWGFAARHGCRGDYDIVFGEHVAHCSPLTAVKLLAHGFGVPALPPRGFLPHIEDDEARAKVFDLFLPRGADVIAPHARA